MQEKAVPLYKMVVDELKEKIAKGVYAEKGSFPTEKVLSEKYGISRVTVRKALDVLTSMGYIYSVKGSGYFVETFDKKMYMINFNSMTKLYKYVRLYLKNFEPTDALVGFEGFDPSYNAVVSVGAIMNGNLAVAVAYMYFNIDMEVPQFCGATKNEDISLFQKDLELPSYIPETVDIYPELPDEETQRLLECEPNEPLICTVQRYYNEDATIHSLGKVYYRRAFGNLKGTLIKQQNR